MAASETLQSSLHTERAAPTEGPIARTVGAARERVKGHATELLGRARSMLGWRDYRGEIAGYRLALADADSAHTGLIADRLLELLHSPVGSEALGLVVGVMDRLDPERREHAMLVGRGRWGRACALAAIETNPERRLSAARLIGQIADPEAFNPLREMLRDQDPRVAEEAARSLVHIAERAGRSPAMDARAREAVDWLVARCASTFEQHRRRETLIALVALWSSPAARVGARAELKAWISDTEQPGRLALRALIRRGVECSRQSAWIWMALPDMRGACVERLSVPCDTNGYDSVLAEGHLLRNPAREAALVGARDKISLATRAWHRERTREKDENGGANRDGPTGERDGSRGARRALPSGLSIEDVAIDRLSPAATAHAPRWISCTHEAGAGRTRILEEFLVAPSDLARMNALRVAPRGPGSDLLLDFCFDPHAAIARSAMLEAGSPARRGELPREGVRRTMRALARGGPKSMRSAAERIADAIDPLGGSDASLGAAHRALRANRAEIIASLQNRIRTESGAERIAAIRLAQRLGLAPQMELELLALVSLSTHATAQTQTSEGARHILHAAASAVVTLAELPSPAAQHALHKCLRHPDGRIRANALDAMARVARRSGSIGDPKGPIAGAIVELKGDDHHRVRTAAARAMLMASARGGSNAGGATTTIMPLLSDPRPMHRISGLWLAERASGRAANRDPKGDGAAALAIAVAEMVRADPEPEVKERAKATAARLLSSMRAGWAERLG